MKFGIFRMISFILAVNLPLITHAEQIHLSGKIEDSVTAKELANVTVYINNLQDGRIDSTLSNAMGFWEYDLNLTSLPSEPGPPRTFNVSHNYPNPFNPSTRIDLAIPEATEVKVSVFNALGEIMDFHQENLNAGHYSISWNSKGSAGVYFISFQTKSGTITRKMIQLDGGHGSGLSQFHKGNKDIYSLPMGASKIHIRFSTSRFGYIDYSLETEVEGGEYFEFSVESIHHHYTLIDLHNDILEKMIEDPDYHLADLHTYNHTDIPRLLLGGVDVQLFVVWVDPSYYLQNSFSHAMAMIDIFNTELSQNSTKIVQARNAAETVAINNQNKIAAVLVVEGGHAIENDLKKLQSLYDEGMRYLTITWNNSTDWAVSAQDSRSANVGLSEFGREVIRTLDSLGVIIDISHTGIKTIEDILEVSQNPIIASHSGVRALRNHYRNLYDDQIRDIAKVNGVIGIVFYPPFLASSGYADVATVANHIDYVVNLVGIDYVAIGSDFDGIGTNTVDGLEDVSQFPDLTLELLSRGYTNSDIDRILGANFKRVFEKVCGN